MTRAREDDTVHIVQPDWYRENKPTLPEQAVLARIRREKAWTAAGWLACAVLALFIVILAIAVFAAWHAGGSLTGGG